MTYPELSITGAYAVILVFHAGSWKWLKIPSDTPSDDIQEKEYFIKT